MPFLGGRAQASRGYFGGGTTPDAPTSLVATRGNTEISVAFSAPVFNGGLDITNYQYSLNAGTTWTAFSPADIASPVLVTGLNNGTAYTVYLRAVNTLGSGTTSAPANAVTPATVPGTPTSPSISSGNLSISVSWGAPVSDGGNPPLTYTVETQKNSEAYVDRGLRTSPYPLSADNGATYRARITANNTVGSSATAAVTGDTVPSGVPDAPAAPTATIGNGQVVLSWVAPANNGSNINDYDIEQTTNDGVSWTDRAYASATVGTTVDSLSNGTEYKFRVRATNVRGSSSFSAASAGYTPATIPNDVATPTSSAGDRSFTISWTAPGNGGTAITTYWVQYSTDNVNWVGTEDVGNVLTKTWTGDGTNFRNNGTTYYGRVIAFNAIGNSNAWSAGSTGRVPAFQSSGTISVASESTSAPAYNEDGGGVVTAGVGHSGYRVMNVSFDPPNVSAFSYAYIQAHSDATGTFGNCLDAAGNTPIFYSDAGQIVGFYYYHDYSYYGIATRFYPGYNYAYRMVTVNTDGDQVISAETSLVSTEYQYYYTYDGAQQTTTSGTSYVNANSYTNDVESASQDIHTKTYSVTCYAASTTGTSTICTTQRYFVSQWTANTSYSGLTSYTGLQSPWSNNTGTTFRSASIGATSPYGSGLRVRVIGNGSIASGWSPTISVYYVIKYRNRYYNSW